jgi:hypothetical protein
MNNEPVAWMELYYGEPNNIAWTDTELKDSGEIYKTVPLYTHPVKEPTDEEINELWLVTCSKAGEVEDMQLHFARAILRKAQE